MQSYSLQRGGAELQPSEVWCRVTVFRGVVQSYSLQRGGAELQSSEWWCRVTAFRGVVQSYSLQRGGAELQPPDDWRQCGHCGHCFQSSEGRNSETSFRAPLFIKQFYLYCDVHSPSVRLAAKFSCTLYSGHLVRVCTVFVLRPDVFLEVFVDARVCVCVCVCVRARACACV